MNLLLYGDDISHNEIPMFLEGDCPLFNYYPLTLLLSTATVEFFVVRVASVIYC